jgi:hypothetical protein
MGRDCFPVHSDPNLRLDITTWIYTLSSCLLSGYVPTHVPDAGYHEEQLRGDGPHTVDSLMVEADRSV